MTTVKRQREKMIKTIAVSIAVVMAIVIFCLPASAGGLPPAVGGQLPNIKVAMSKESADNRYLGFFGFGSFKIPEIKTTVVIVEIFSMYCPYCQKEAPVVNQLYTKIEQNPALKDNIKLIGIGVGNSPYEVGIFKKKYNVPFPLFSDADYVIHKQVGEVRTPYFIGVKINPDGTHQVIYSKLGAFDSVDAFLSTIVKLSGLQ